MPKTYPRDGQRQPTPEPEPSLPYALSLAHAAEQLDVSVDLLEDHIRPHMLTGRIESYQIGARRVVVWKSLIAFLDDEHGGALPGYANGLRS